MKMALAIFNIIKKTININIGILKIESHERQLIKIAEYRSKAMRLKSTLSVIIFNVYYINLSITIYLYIYINILRNIVFV